MKKVIFIILILVLLVGGIIVIRDYKINEFQKNINNTSDEKLNNTINTEKDNLNTNNTENATANIEYSTLNIKKITENQYNSYYEPIEEEAKKWITVEEQSNNLTICLLETKENDILLDGSKKVEYNKRYNIIMSEPDKVKSIYYCIMGQDIDYPLIFLLQEDGLVKVIETKEGYKTGNFEAKDIKELENVKKIEQVSITPPNDSGYIGVVAITYDNQIYEIKSN